MIMICLYKGSFNPPIISNNVRVRWLIIAKSNHQFGQHSNANQYFVTCFISSLIILSNTISCIHSRRQHKFLTFTKINYHFFLTKKYSTRFIFLIRFLLKKYPYSLIKKNLLSKFRHNTLLFLTPLNLSLITPLIIKSINLLLHICLYETKKCIGKHSWGKFPNHF